MVVRFDATERAYHWAQALPVLALIGSGGLLWWQRFAGVRWFDPGLLVTIHKVSGCVLPAALLAAFLAGNRRKLLANARLAWNWGCQDLHWFAASTVRIFFRQRQLPPAGKFNAGQKLNLAAQTVLLPVSILTGALLWAIPGALLSWYLHWAVFLLVTLLVAGHLYLALLHPSTRRGLNGVFTGRVDATWARRHYPKAFGSGEEEGR